jgi:O-acetyl-ADP-ribose deacetylase (regulator of RNase III)
MKLLILVICLFSQVSFGSYDDEFYLMKIRSINRMQTLGGASKSVRVEAVESDGNCGLSALGISRQDFVTLVCENRAQLEYQSIISTMIKKQFNLEAATIETHLDLWKEKLLEQTDTGSFAEFTNQTHLQVLAKIKSYKIFVYILSDLEDIFVPYYIEGEDTEESVYPINQAGDTIFHIAWIDASGLNPNSLNHFEKLIPNGNDEDQHPENNSFNATNKKIEDLVECALREIPKFRCALLPAIPEQRRELLGDALIAMETPASKALLSICEDIFSLELQQQRPICLDPTKAIKDLLWLKHGVTKLAIWKGDITFLNVDVIVNAANSQGLGCFMPAHRCVDNVIHRAAGPSLREECREKMNLRSQPLLAGSTPLLTKGYFLPAKNVLHIVGPQLQRGVKPRDQDVESLKLAYINCLSEAKMHDLHSIAFCCISTGLFAFPPRLAANIALKTVKEWLDKEKDFEFDKIIFAVFTPDNWILYNHLAARYFKSF